MRRRKVRAGVGERLIKKRARKENERHQRRRRVMRMLRTQQKGKSALYLPIFMKYCSHCLKTTKSHLFFLEKRNCFDIKFGEPN
jgi:hypothetical protein